MVFHFDDKPGRAKRDRLSWLRAGDWARQALLPLPLLALAACSDGQMSPADLAPLDLAPPDLFVASGTATVYPPLTGSPYGSDRYLVEVGPVGSSGQDSYVYRSINNGDKRGVLATADANHWTSFDFTGAVQVKVTALMQTTIDTASLNIRPLSKGVTATAKGNTVTFTLTTPGQYYVDIAGEKLNPLLVFANPPDAPPTCGGNVICVGPGVTDWATTYPGGLLTMQSGQTLYLAGGAYVKGRVNLPMGTGQVTLRGRGILSGIDYPKGDFTPFMVVGGNAYKTQMTMEGLTFTDTPAMVINNYAGSSNIANVKVMNWHLTGDGIAPGSNSTVTQSFFKVRDDNLHLDSNNVNASDLVFWLQLGGSALLMSWNVTTNITAGKVSGVDVIANDWVGWPSSVPGVVYNVGLLSAQNFAGTFSGGGVTYSGLTVENVRMETTPVQVFAMQTKGQLTNYTQGLGTIDGVILRNIDVVKPPIVKSVFDGNGTMTGFIQNITFENVTIAGTKITSANSANYLTLKGSTKNIVFK